MTEIVFILDKSGSMQSIKSDAVGGFNQFLTEQKEVQDDTTMSLVLFDSSYTKLYENVSLADVKVLEENEYRPSAMTALYDAIGYTIESVSQRKKEGDNVLCAILTDGEENRSQKYTKEAIFKMIEDCKNNGWEFIFLAANQDAMKAAGAINISTANSMNFSATADGMSNTYNVLSKSTKMYRSMKLSSVGASMDSSSLIADTLKDMDKDVKAQPKI